MDIVILKNYFLPFFAALIISLMMTYLIRVLAVKLKIVDWPNVPRKIHDRPVPALGGWAIYLTFLLLTIIFYQSGLLLDGKIQTPHIFGFLIGGLILMIGGALDDKYKLKPGAQFIFPVLASLAVIFSGITIDYVTAPAGGVWHLDQTLIAPLLVFIWLLGMMYTTKFLDGLDGLVSGVAVIGSLILFLVSLFWDVPLSGTSILCLILAGSALGFLFWNFYPAKIFLGESGSLFLGFSLAILSIISGAKIATALLIMGIPILDVAWVIFRRIVKEKKSAFVGDSKHLHFRLLDAGLNHRQAVLFLYLLTLLFGASSLFQQTMGKLISLLILAAVMLFLAWWVVARYNCRQKR